MKIPLMDIAAQYRAIRAEVDEAIRQVLESGHFILGPQVAALEDEVVAYLGVQHAVGVASGTDALVLALRALDIGPGDEVIVPAYTFFATAEAVMLVGATPVFVDIRRDTYCLDVEQAAARITKDTKALIAVHLYGHPADMSPLLELARSHRLKLIEDNAQAFGAEYDSRKTAALGDVGCLSFFPSKNLGAFGDAGMVVTNDAGVADIVRVLRTHGWRKKFRPEIVGHNSRLDELQATILRVKLPHVDEWNNRRRALALRYEERLRDMNFGLPCELPNARHVYHLYVIRVPERSLVIKHLSEQGVASAVYYPQPLHLVQACRELGYRAGDFPEAELAAQETLAIPLYPEMSEQQLRFVAGSLEQTMTATGIRS